MLGLFKRLFRRTKVGSLQEIAQVVDQSAVCNIPQLIADEKGTTIVPIMNWSNFFSPYLKKISGIKQYHRFHFDSAQPGIVRVKEHSESEFQSISLLKGDWNPDSTEMPAVIPVKPLSAERQWYLYDSIRPFCSYETKDITCPLPNVPKPGSRNRSPFPDEHSLNPIVSQLEMNRPATKKQCLCTKCNTPGHNSRTCNLKSTFNFPLFFVLAKLANWNILNEY